MIQQKLPEFSTDEETVLVLLERVNEAQRLATRELREMQAVDPRNNKSKRRDRLGNGDSGVNSDDEGGGSSSDHQHNNIYEDEPKTQITAKASNNKYKKQRR